MRAPDDHGHPYDHTDIKNLLGAPSLVHTTTTNEGETMSHTRVLETHNASPPVDLQLLTSAIDDLNDCISACVSCADACLTENQPDQLNRCIRFDLDCADICTSTARVLGRLVAFPTEVVRPQLQAACVALEACAEECERHAGEHEHCQACAESCREADQTLHRLMEALG